SLYKGKLHSWRYFCLKTYGISPMCWLILLYFLLFPYTYTSFILFMISKIALDISHFYNLLSALSAMIPFTSYTIALFFFKLSRSNCRNSLCATPNTMASYLDSSLSLEWQERLYSCSTSTGFAQGS